MNDTPIPYDEQMSRDREIQEREQSNKAHDSGEMPIGHKTCEHIHKEGDEIFCCFVNNELNFCGVPCPRTKGEEKNGEHNLRDTVKYPKGVKSP